LQACRLRMSTSSWPSTQRSSSCHLDPGQLSPPLRSLSELLLKIWHHSPLPILLP
jgi:hypothetical protein